jgi:hypothetical protein
MGDGEKTFHINMLKIFRERKSENVNFVDQFDSCKLTNKIFVPESFQSLSEKVVTFGEGVSKKGKS